MREAWRDLPDAYLGLAAPDFPNYFVICGPQGPLGNGSILPAVGYPQELFYIMSLHEFRLN